MTFRGLGQVAQQQAAQGADNAGAADNGKAPNGDNVVDADFEQVD